MQYRIEGGSLPVVLVRLTAGEQLISQAGGRTWSRGPVQTETKAEGGAGGALGRLFTGESLFMSRYTARGDAEIAFASTFPGSIVARQLAAGESIVCQKRAFLAATLGVKLSVFFQKRLGVGLVGGEGFLMQRVTGPGTAFFEIDGYAAEYTLAPGEQIVCDTGALALMDATCSVDVRLVNSVKGMIFGGEGIFDTVITGPGKVTLQTMSAAQLAQILLPYLPTQTSSH